MTTPLNINAALQLLQEKYLKELPAKLAEISTLLEALRRAEKFDADMAQSLHRMVHSLSGSGATFGLTELSVAAKTLEHTIKEIEQNAVLVPEQTLMLLKTQWSAVKLAATHPVAVKLADSLAETKAAPVNNAGIAEKKSGGYILLVEDDVDLAHNLELQLGHLGYEVKVLHDTRLLYATVKDNPPSLIIMDITFPEGNLAGPQAILGLPEAQQGVVPVIFISSRSDIKARLSAVRSGAVAYFTKPLDMGALVDKLDSLTSENSSDDFKVLIVEDSPSLASFYAMTLQSAGMETAVVYDPLKMLDILSDFTPELILMDMYMPGCSGLELAKIIRQQEAYVSTPIVFLSAETDLDKQLEALQFGADDFLTKPIQPAHLISAVASRVRRYRVLHSFMVRDSLTGLLNHTTIKEELDVEITRAQRQKNAVVFAMIDIDFFKKVNDTYGHPTGDRVIKTISRLLQQRLRKSDVIGRYGGEEFAVVLKDTDAASALVILDNIRKAFEKIIQHSDKGDFSVSFSCGLAEFPKFANSTAICNAADRALYEAKSAGRNRVVIA